MPAAASPDSLSAVRLSKSYGSVRVLDDVSLSVRPGSVHGIVGHNGAGKSTLFKLLVGAAAPDRGSIRVGAKEVPALTPRQAFNLGVELVPQEPNLVPGFSAAENIALGRYPAGRLGRVRWRRVAEEAARAAERVGLQAPLDRETSRLAPVDQRLVMVARAVLHDRRFLIFDEPTAPLSDREVTRLLKVLGELRASGLGLIFCSHRLDEVLTICDEVTALQGGRTIAHKEAKRFDREELVRMVGAAAGGAEPTGTPLDPQRKISEGPPVLAVRGLTGVHARNVGFDLHRGEILGLAGLAGSGRSEVARMIAGVQRPEAGRIEVGGEGVDLRSPRDAIARRIALIPENRHRDGCILDMSLQANIGLPTIARRAGAGIIRHRAERSVTREMIEELRIQPANPDAPLKAFSGGNQQKAIVGKWLLSQSEIYIFDEPTAGVDVGAAAEIHRLIRQLADGGSSVILVCSDFDEFPGLADRVLVLREGEVVAELTKSRVAKETMLAEIYAGAPQEPVES